MCMVKYVPSPWNIGQRNFDLPCCHIASIKWCNALFPGIQGSRASQLDFDHSATRNFIYNHIRLAANCPYYGHTPIERPLSMEWCYFGSYEIFVIDHLPTPRARLTNSARWVAERIMEAAMARAQRDHNQQQVAAGNQADGENGGEKMAVDGGNICEKGTAERKNTDEQVAAEQESASALMTPDRSSPIGEEGGNGRRAGSGSRGRSS